MTVPVFAFNPAATAAGYAAAKASEATQREVANQTAVLKAELDRVRVEFAAQLSEMGRSQEAFQRSTAEREEARQQEAVWMRELEYRGLSPLAAQQEARHEPQRQAWLAAANAFAIDLPRLIPPPPSADDYRRFLIGLAADVEGQVRRHSSREPTPGKRLGRFSSKRGPQHWNGWLQQPLLLGCSVALNYVPDEGSWRQATARAQVATVLTALERQAGMLTDSLTGLGESMLFAEDYAAARNRYEELIATGKDQYADLLGALGDDFAQLGNVAGLQACTAGLAELAVSEPGRLETLELSTTKGKLAAAPDATQGTRALAMQAQEFQARLGSASARDQWCWMLFLEGREKEAVDAFGGLVILYLAVRDAERAARRDAGLGPPEEEADPEAELRWQSLAPLLGMSAGNYDPLLISGEDRLKELERNGETNTVDFLALRAIAFWRDGRPQLAARWAALAASESRKPFVAACGAWRAQAAPQSWAASWFDDCIAVFGA